MVKSWQVVLATLGIFLAGLVTGGATALGVVKWMAHRARGEAGALETRSSQYQPFGPQLIKAFVNQLGLTEDQRARIGPIVERTAEQLGHDRREVQLSSALAIEKMQDDIADTLTPDQRAKFLTLIAQQRARLQELRQRMSQGPKRAPALLGAPPPK
jgi:Spy/CpxP family protein refolding chaperone